MADEKAPLMRLRDSGLTVANRADDLRGRNVRNTAGDELGTVEALIIDAEEEKVRFLRVEHGGILGFGATPSLIPVEAVTDASGDEVKVDLSRERIAGAPRYDPALVDDQQYYEALYDYYGYQPATGSSGIYGSTAG